jgi:hypothetical protein
MELILMAMWSMADVLCDVLLLIGAMEFGVGRSALYSRVWVGLLVVIVVNQ